ncbi:MAG: helix-turn-helix transcriptional regulator [Pseudobutyrivibrio sp.]|nr:helix-turn-helix transcriptional regulator [Pseudobutyrivibrio sp.]
MRDEFIEKLKNGTTGVDASAINADSTIDCRALLDQGKLITISRHVPTLHFPPHTHNYVEVVYMCAGSTTHIINGQTIELKAGELLFLNQNSVQEILPATEEDIAVNFIILPEFFDYGLSLLNTEESLLKDFLIDCVVGTNKKSGYLHFKVSDACAVQNLLENLIYYLLNEIPNRRSMNQMTMGLLLLELTNCVDDMATDAQDEESRLAFQVLSYVEENYKDGELTELAGRLHFDVYWLSREIKRITGYNYTDLIQAKRLTQAAYLLSNTKLSVLEVAAAVGYENASYFHRIFKNKYGCSPKKYRDQ